MNCPHCNFHFGVLFANADKCPPIAPILCEGCAEVSLLIGGRKIRKLSAEELAEVKESPAWKEVLEPAIQLIKSHKKAKKAILN